MRSICLHFAFFMLLCDIKNEKGIDMTDKSLFRKIAKQVHPDMSVGSDATSGDRMCQAIKFKNDPDMLVRLARKWGLNIDGSFNEKAFNERSEAFKQRVFDAVVGAIIEHTITYKKKLFMVHGVIVNKRKITRGHYKNATEFKIYNFRDNSILVLKSFNGQPFDKIMGMADEFQVNDGIEKIEQIRVKKKERAAIRQDRANDMFASLGLVANLMYRGNFKVLVNYKYGAKWENLERTTAKCVFLTSGRRINIRSILNAKENHIDEKV